jgi:hypothetical protein
VSAQADLGVLKALKGAVDARNSVCHGATVLANALMHAGTSRDTFLRDNLEWLSRATNWAKFSATAGLGVIHRGQLSQGEAGVRGGGGGIGTRGWVVRHLQQHGYPGVIQGPQQHWLAQVA